VIRRNRVAVILTAVALVATACAQVSPSPSVPGASPASRVNTVSRCPLAPVIPRKGAPAPLGLNAHGIAPPRWSAVIGAVGAVDGQTAFTNNGCVLAVNIATGRPLWSWLAPGHPGVMAVTENQGIVLVATGHYQGTAPAAVFRLIDHITALDATTGQQLWTLALTGHGDGQWMPAAIASGVAIVTEADGTVEGLDARTGTLRWADPIPSTCHPTGQDPVASIFTAEPIVGYQCATGAVLTALTPATGAARWTWQAPSGWSFDLPPEAASTGGVTALVADGPGHTAVPRQSTWTLGPQGYDPVQVVAIDDTTGHPVWELDGVDAAAGVYASDGQICAASWYGAQCLAARTGAESWQWRPVLTPDDEPGGGVNAAAAAGGRLYDIAPTSAAARISSQSTTQRSAPGTFILQARDITTGRLISTRLLPSYYAGDSGVVVSVDTPPVVAATGGPMVLVAPEYGESDVVEAFDMMTG
jgi:outer membrane protein assembly factor BamB